MEPLLTKQADSLRSELKTVQDAVGTPGYNIASTDVRKRAAELLKLPQPTWQPGEPVTPIDTIIETLCQKVSESSSPSADLNSLKTTVGELREETNNLRQFQQHLILLPEQVRPLVGLDQQVAALSETVAKLPRATATTNGTGTTEVDKDLKSLNLRVDDLYQRTTKIGPMVAAIESMAKTVESTSKTLETTSKTVERLKVPTVREEQGKLKQQETSPIGDIGILIYQINKRMEAIEALKADLKGQMATPNQDIDNKINAILEEKQAETQQAIKQAGDDVCASVTATLQESTTTFIGQIDAHKEATSRVIEAKSGEAVTSINKATTGALTQVTSKSAETVAALDQEQRRLLGELREPMDHALAQLETTVNSALADLADHLGSARGNLEQLATALQQRLEKQQSDARASLSQAHASIENLATASRQQLELQKSEIQTLHGETQTAKDTTVRVAGEIQKSLDGIVDIRERAEEATENKERAVREAEEAMRQAKAAAATAYEIQQAVAIEAKQAKERLVETAQSEIAQVQEQFDRIMRLELIMSALDGAVNKIYANSTTSGSRTVDPTPGVGTSGGATSGNAVIQPRVVTNTSPVVTPTESRTVDSENRTSPLTETGSVPPVVSPPEVLTPGTSAFSFLARLTQFVNIQWSDVMGAVEKRENRFFTNRRLQDLDLILYGDLRTLLNASGEPVSEALATELELARTQYRQQLTLAGMLRIEGKPGDRVRPYWLEADQVDSVPTSDPKLADTYADIVPGNAGYQLGERALKPTLARFYKLSGS